MNQPYLATIIAVGFNFAPVGWALCNGALLQISGNEALYALLGTTYGGNGTTDFALPDLRGRVCISEGQGPGLGNYTLGQASGFEIVTVSSNQMGAHSHPAVVNATAASGTTNIPSATNGPAKAVDSGGTPFSIYGPPDGQTLMQGGPTSFIGGSQPHDNMQPYLAVNFIIATEGIFPQRS